MAEWGPADPEKLLFAIDVIKCLLLRYHSHLFKKFIKTDRSTEAESVRGRISSDYFDGNVRSMVEEIVAKRLIDVSKEFRDIKDHEDLSESSLIDFIQESKGNHLRRGFSCNEFLAFCAEVSLMSLRFFERGRNDATDIAVDYIKNAFPDDKKECKLFWKEMKNASKKYRASQGSATIATSRRESEQIGSEESSSSSSASNTESDSTAEAANLSSASSAESLHENLNFNAMNLNTSSLERANNAEVNDILVQSEPMEVKPTIQVFFAVTDSNMGSSNVHSTECALTATSSSTVEINKPLVQNEPMEVKPTIRVTFAANDLIVECSNVDSKECAPTVTSSSTVEINIGDVSLSSDRFAIPKYEFHIRKNTEIPLPNPEPETMQITSPRKSLLGKRPSPRRANPIMLRKYVAYDSETEIKKPRLELPVEDTAE